MSSQAPPIVAEWAEWRGDPRRTFTVGIEEEVVLVREGTWAPAPCADAVRLVLPSDLAPQVLPETHASVLELRTGVNQNVASAVEELSALRGRLVTRLRGLRLAALPAATYPLPRPRPSLLSGGVRYREIAREMGYLARRDPTMALHVHVGVPGPDEAIRVLRWMREAIPVLLALSANSPFLDGRESGFASTRTTIFDGFPRTGPPRAFSSYADYVAAIDPLLACRAVPEPTFLWWDVRVQPGLGTVEVRVMDTQLAITATAALVAFVQALAHLELTEPTSRPATPPEILTENRFRAARDGIHARLVDDRGRLAGVGELAERLLVRCGPHAAALGCADELDAVRGLMAVNGAETQRRIAAADGVRALPAALALTLGPGVSRVAHLT